MGTLPDSWDIEVDVVSIGTGLGGLTSAMVAHDAGCEVVIVEKSAKLGGICAYSGGEVFVPKMASMRVSDVADVVAPEAKRKIIGIRPSEKLHEMLFVPEEARHAVELDDYFVIEPEHAYWSREQIPGGRPVATDFTFSSDRNERWLGQAELRAMVEEM